MLCSKNIWDENTLVIIKLHSCIIELSNNSNELLNNFIARNTMKKFTISSVAEQVVENQQVKRILKFWIENYY